MRALRFAFMLLVLAVVTLLLLGLLTLARPLWQYVVDGWQSGVLPTILLFLWAMACIGIAWDYSE